MLKKHVGILLGIIALSLVATPAFASSLDTSTIPADGTTQASYTCTAHYSPNTYTIISSTGAVISTNAHCVSYPSAEYGFMSTTPQTVYFFEFNATVACATKLSCESNSHLISTQTLSVGDTSLRGANAYVSVLGGTAPSVGTPVTGTVFSSGLTAAVGATNNGLGPILALVVGLILAFVFATYMIGIFRQVNRAKEAKEYNDKLGGGR